MKLPLPIIGLLLFAWLRPAAQPGYEILKNVKKIDIPFEFKNNLILVNVTFDRVFPLKFIFDTRAENSILSKRSITDLLGIRYEREFKILGSDMKTELTAYLVRGIHLKIEDMVAPNHTMLVLEEDYFNFEELLGMEVHGILGADIFKGLTLKINYERKVITLSKSNASKPPPVGFQMLPIVVEKNKPYLTTTIRTQNDTTINVKLLLDSGAMLSLLLNTDSHPALKPPENTIQGNIGAGLGGFINGHIGRVSTLSFGELQCNEVVTNFQTLDDSINPAMMQGRNGIIGNEVLSRFEVIIDYPGEKLYLRPNKRYKTDFEFDKSGLVLIAGNQNLNQYLVHAVLHGSPVEVAGILPGDEIKRINGTPAGLLSLERIYQLMRKKEGKKIKMVVKRDGERIKFEFNLRKLI